jgi:hypothetical protein
MTYVGFHEEPKGCFITLYTKFKTEMLNVNLKHVILSNTH